MRLFCWGAETQSNRCGIASLFLQCSAQGPYAMLLNCQNLVVG